MPYTGSPLVLYNAECKSEEVQKLSGAVFCTRSTAEKLTILYQVNGKLVLYRLSENFCPKKPDGLTGQFFIRSLKNNCTVIFVRLCVFAADRKKPVHKIGFAEIFFRFHIVSLSG